jgi:hypothetical protein
MPYHFIDRSNIQTLVRFGKAEPRIPLPDMPSVISKALESSRFSGAIPT